MRRVIQHAGSLLCALLTIGIVVAGLSILEAMRRAPIDCSASFSTKEICK
ncbi:hypothetical protein [Ancylobacter rudongensis]|uniref:Uncharacterized protein n=1 Tax=Ancylobacter rudongensis TaxID=177413 RepID=A0A1G4UQN0_9HYPH|nr:hypothetical protein [Ancylobacter rudongensis]SCW95942.1 hypothetical protein SAMN05660859_0154 [Ancylobacter rudongensis]